MKKKKHELAIPECQVDESRIFERVAGIIETRKTRSGMYANRELTLMYWEIGHYVNSVLLGGSRAAYGKRIVSMLSSQLSWSHFLEILLVKTDEGRLYYANEVAQRGV